MPAELSTVLGISSVFTLFFFVYPAPLIVASQVAVGALLP